MRAYINNLLHLEEKVVYSCNNDRNGTNLDADYMSERWSKSYSREQNRIFDSRVKSYIIDRDRHISS